MPATHRADARKKIVWSVLLFGIVTCLNFFLPKLWPSGATGLYYGSGVVVHWTMALRPFRDVPVQVVDISKLVDPTSGKFDRFKLAKLVEFLGSGKGPGDKPRILGLAIDNDFSVDGPTEPPGEADLLRAALALQARGIPVAFGVERRLMEPADQRFYRSDPTDSGYSKQLRALQASMYLRRRIEFDRDANKILGPHWAPVEHRFQLANGEWDALPSFAGRLVPKRNWVKEVHTFWLESGETEEHEAVTSVERVIDLGLIGTLEGNCIRCRDDGTVPVNAPVSGGTRTADLRQFDDKYVILAAVDEPEPHDRFNIAGFGSTSGGVVQGAAIASLVNGNVYELTQEGNLAVDFLTTVLIGTIAHMVVRKKPARHAAEHRIELSWTLLVILITLLISVLLAWLGSIVWYHSMNFVAGHVMLLTMSFLVTRNPKGLKSGLGRFVRYWFLGESAA